ncbi:hypothetical protein [Nocardia lasii]|uniref:hypothetical protein n=1 Tax=Nocardia lasii TaxID=1616107 RepID=UPI00366BDB89
MPCRAEHCPDARCLYSGDGTLSGALRGLVVADWEVHLHRTMTMMPVQLAHDSLVEAQQRLAEAVRFVRGSGASWEDVGAAAGGITGSAARGAFG